MLFTNKGTHKTRVDSWKTTKEEAQRRRVTSSQSRCSSRTRARTRHGLTAGRRRRRKHKGDVLRAASQDALHEQGHAQDTGWQLEETTKVEAQRRTPTPEETQQSHVIQPIAVDHGSWTVSHDPGTNQEWIMDHDQRANDPTANDRGSWIMVNEQWSKRIGQRARRPIRMDHGSFAMGNDPRHGGDI